MNHTVLATYHIQVKSHKIYETWGSFSPQRYSIIKTRVERPKKKHDEAYGVASVHGEKSEDVQSVPRNMCLTYQETKRVRGGGHHDSVCSHKTRFRKVYRSSGIVALFWRFISLKFLSESARNV